MSIPKITFIHSLNNYTGSPNVLSVIIRGMIERGYQAELITSRGEGFLSNIGGLTYKYTRYRWCDNRLATLFLLIVSQVMLFFNLIFRSRRPLYYINTIVPVGALLACWLTRKHYMIHVHENMQQSKPTYTIYRTIYRWCNRKSIFVSHYLKGTALNCREGKVVYNGLSDSYFRTAETNPRDRQAANCILMVASQRLFKGIYDFVALAAQMPKYRFELVLSSTEAEVAAFRWEIGHVSNLTIYPLQTNLHPFYRRAKLLLQLSHPELCVETFGLTILEAMVYGVPAIVPPIGGPVELVQDGMNGFTVSPHDQPTIRQKINLLMNDAELYRQFSDCALHHSKQYNERTMLNQIETYIK